MKARDYTMRPLSLHDASCLQNGGFCCDAQLLQMRGLCKAH